MSTRTIKVDYLARVEGEGGLFVSVRDGKVEDVQLRIFEPPRFFEAFLRGRKFAEAPDVTARICGICPVAYQMSSVHAIENALGVTVGGQLRELRRLLYCGEWIESHTLHIHMLHAPDFLGFHGAVDMAKVHPEIVKRGLALKKTGNEIITVVGGREIHPVNVKVGGFHKAPAKRDLRALLDPLQRARDAALETVRWTSGLEFPDYTHDFEYVSLRHEAEYPMNEGRLVSDRGLDISVPEYEEHFVEEHVAHSSALHSTIRSRGSYLCGPAARLSLNFDKLPTDVQSAARDAGLPGHCRNPFRSIVVRAVEVLYACEEALRIVRNYEVPDAPSVPLEPKASTGFGCTEAPRGILYQRFRLLDNGDIAEVRIVPPTSQNQKSIEEDMRRLVPTLMSLPEDEMTRRCEQSVRNYDPCISCATHFLKLHWDRR